MQHITICPEFNDQRKTNLSKFLGLPLSLIWTRFQENEWASLNWVDFRNKLQSLTPSCQENEEHLVWINSKWVRSHMQHQHENKITKLFDELIW